MYRQPVAAGLLSLLILTLGGCSGDERPQGQDESGGAAGIANVPGEGGASGAVPSRSGGAGGAGGPSTSAGAGGEAVTIVAGAGGSDALASECGNGVREAGEACDGDDIGGFTCEDVGFDSGPLTCSGLCEMDLSQCVGVEHCSDGLDNDGDRLADCADDDCSAACNDVCSSPEEIPENGVVSGLLEGHADSFGSLCLAGAPAVAFQVTPTVTGILEANLLQSGLRVVSVHTTCGEATTEIDCTSDYHLEVPVEAGETYFVVIQGDASDGRGEFQLSLSTRVPACGNRARENEEECDDGNLLDGDGCSADCLVESSEDESNRSPGRANPYVSPFYGFISGEGDRDYVEVAVDEPPRTIHIRIFDFGDQACNRGELDSVVTLFAPDGKTILAEDDDGGMGYCSEIDFLPDSLETGNFYVMVESSEFGSSFEFPYILVVDVNLCGNGILSPNEECDDGNVTSLDGCSERCESEE